MNGMSQAVRLPKAFRFEGKEVYIRKEGDAVILTPKRDRNPMQLMEDFFLNGPLPSEDFMPGRIDELPQKRESLDD